MDEWRKDARRDVVITDIDALVPENHLPRKKANANKKKYQKEQGKRRRCTRNSCGRK